MELVNYMGASVPVRLNVDWISRELLPTLGLMGIHVHWFLPTSGDSREVVGFGPTAGR